jgi:glutamine synthetase
MTDRRRPTTIDELRKAGVSRVELALTDVDGVLRGKYVSLDKFASLLDGGGGFCDCVFGWDVADQLYDNARYTGWHTGYPDVQYRLIADTQRTVPETNVPLFLGEFVAAEGGDHPICPRTRLRNVLERAAALSIHVKLAFEYEFFVFDETPHSIRAKGFRDLKPFTPGNFGYSVLRASTHENLFGGLMAYAAGLGTPLEAVHCETGPGVWEAAIEVADALTAADRANLFKTFTKVFFQKRELMATFMAKWSMKYPGMGGHCHFSFWSPDGKALFHDAGAPHRMGTTQRYALGGLQRYLPEFIALLAPTVNSYARLVKGAWAPTAFTWGVENRTTAVRLIPGSAKSQRLECRVPGADANPYLAAAAIVGAALLGVAEGLEPAAPTAGNAYDVADRMTGASRFPVDLRDAADRLARSDAAQKLFGAPFVEHFVSTRQWEVREYTRSLNDWQLERYFEII